MHYLNFVKSRSKRNPLGKAALRRLGLGASVSASDGACTGIRDGAMARSLAASAGESGPRSRSGRSLPRVLRRARSFPMWVIPWKDSLRLSRTVDRRSTADWAMSGVETIYRVYLMLPSGEAGRFIAGHITPPPAAGCRSTPMAAVFPTCIPACTASTPCRRACARCAAPPPPKSPTPGSRSATASAAC
jgi:hypothetical protein